VLKLKSLMPELAYVNEAPEAEPAPTIPELTLLLTAAAPEGGLEVELASSAPERLAVAESITVPEGQKLVVVPVVGLLGGDDPVDLTATMDEVQVSAQVLVIPPDRIPMPTAMVPEDLLLTLEGELEVTLFIDIPGRPGGTEVQLETAEEGVSVVEKPESVVVPENEFSTTFTLKGLVEGGTILTASTDAGSIEAEVEVVEVQLSGFIITEVYYDHPGGDSEFEWVELYNGTAASLELANFSLGAGGTSYTTSKVQLAGVVEPGQCFVVGGPQADADNGNPTYDQEIDFSPDLQNSGGTADGVALFAQPAETLDNTTIPIDAVIYGGDNSSGLVDETGEAGEVDVDDASGGNSIHLTTEGWAVQPDPTPGDCTHPFTP